MYTVSRQISKLSNEVYVGFEGVASPEQIAEYNTNLVSIDLSGWAVPKVQFVEVRKANSGWVAPPREPLEFWTSSRQMYATQRDVMENPE